MTPIATAITAPPRSVSRLPVRVLTRGSLEAVVAAAAIPCRGQRGAEDRRPREQAAPLGAPAAPDPGVPLRPLRLDEVRQAEAAAREVGDPVAGRAVVLGVGDAARVVLLD